MTEYILLISKLEVLVRVSEPGLLFPAASSLYTKHYDNWLLDLALLLIDRYENDINLLI